MVIETGKISRLLRALYVDLVPSTLIEANNHL